MLKRMLSFIGLGILLILIIYGVHSAYHRREVPISVQDTLNKISVEEYGMTVTMFERYLQIEAIKAQIETRKAYIKYWTANLHIDPDIRQGRKSDEEI